MSIFIIAALKSLPVYYNISFPSVRDSDYHFSFGRQSSWLYDVWFFFPLSKPEHFCGLFTFVYFVWAFCLLFWYQHGSSDGVTFHSFKVKVRTRCFSCPLLIMDIREDCSSFLTCCRGAPVPIWFPLTLLKSGLIRARWWSRVRLPVASTVTISEHTERDL